MDCLRRLHRDERGLSTLETVAILAVAAIALAAAKAGWHRVRRWFKTSVSNVIDWQGDSP